MSEQNANDRYSRLNGIIIGGLLAALFALLAVMFTMLSNSDQQLSSRMSELERKVDENTRQIAEVRVVLAEMQTTLNLIASGLDISVKPKEPKEQAGPATDTPAPSEKLATRDP